MQNATMEKVRQVMGEAVSSLPAYPQQEIDQEFQRAVARTPGLKLLLLSTSDGRAVAEWSAQPVDARRLSAMANSFLTLGETMARELEMTAADYATICTPHGNMVLIRIAGSHPSTLAALGSSDVNMAVVLFAARECANRLQSLVGTPR